MPTNCAALLEIQADIEQGNFSFVQGRDVHMHIEAALVEKLGDIGRKLHTGRSRNDQVATDLKLWTREALEKIDVRLVALQRAFVQAALRHREVILPGYTHMQRAQPVLAAHVFLAYVEKFERDRSRIADCRRRLNLLPLVLPRWPVPACQSTVISSLESWALTVSLQTALMSPVTATLHGVNLYVDCDR